MCPESKENSWNDFQKGNTGKYHSQRDMADAYYKERGTNSPSHDRRNRYVNEENGGNKGVGNSNQLAKPGEDLYVGTYSKSRYGNIKSGLNKTHTPHHAVQDAISETSHGRGITINIRKDLHELTGTFRKTRDIDPTNLRKNLAADISELRNILRNAGYDRITVNKQLKELIRQNKVTGNLLK